MNENNYVRIFDTTLRDGEQSPGASLTSNEKLEVARSLARLGVDVIESGFAAASPDDLLAIQNIGKEVGHMKGPHGRTPIICSLARAVERDIDKSWEAVQFAAAPRIHTFISTSKIHMEHQLRMDPEDVVERAIKMVTHAKSMCADIEFSPMDAGRSEPEFLYLVLGEAIKAGATTLNIPDTVGYLTPQEYFDLIRGIKENTPGIENVIISTHCHDDLGMATANALAGVQAGARQVEVTVNGIGERAGNTSLEEFVMSLKTRPTVFGLETGIETTLLVPVSRQVAKLTGIAVPRNKAIVGANAFAHESGIHQDGMLKHATTYEIMRPADVGLVQTNLVLGKHSGRAALRARLAELGYRIEGEELKAVFSKFKAVADRQKEVSDDDLLELVDSELVDPTRVYKLDGLQVTCGTIDMPMASVRLIDPNGDVKTAVSIGTGPVDAAFKAIDSVVKMPNVLSEYVVRAVTEGIDANGEVTVRLESKNGGSAERIDAESGVSRPRTFGGYGAETDIVVASAMAYLAALNKMCRVKERNGRPVEMA